MGSACCKPDSELESVVVKDVDRNTKESKEIAQENGGSIQDSLTRNQIK